ncbi:hypothetical protein BU17DRAFT_63883 [Hysterangium stoloniferum]|nr:hypothetical protein BU17DRAFT_63883 [Hysterangium stoloniferum]
MFSTKQAWKKCSCAVMIAPSSEGWRLNPNNLLEKSPGDVDALHWGEALDFWEFKLLVKSYVEYLKSAAFNSSGEKQARSKELIRTKTSSFNLQPNKLLVPTRRGHKKQTMPWNSIPPPPVTTTQKGKGKKPQQLSGLSLKPTHVTVLTVPKSTRGKKAKAMVPSPTFSTGSVNEGR